MQNHFQYQPYNSNQNHLGNKVPVFPNMKHLDKTAPTISSTYVSNPNLYIHNNRSI